MKIKLMFLFLLITNLFFSQEKNENKIIIIELKNEKIYFNNDEIILDSLEIKINELKKVNPNLIIRFKVDSKTKMSTVSKVKNVIYRKEEN